MRKILQNKQLILIITVIAVFVVAFAVRFYPIYHKGYLPKIGADTLILARNMTLTNEYKIEDERGVILNPSLLNEKGAELNVGNELTRTLYAKVFDVLGFKTSIPLYVSLILWTLTTVLLFLLILRLFNYWLALLFVLVDIFAPTVLASSILPGAYEWAAFFFTIALLVYLWKPKEDIHNLEHPLKFGWSVYATSGPRFYSRLFLAGLFFGLASLAGNAYLISFIPFLVYEFYRSKSFKKSLILFLPVIILWGAYLGPNLIKEKALKNYYLTSAKTSSSEYLHIFPDPYTYNFEKEEYIKSVSHTRTPDWIKALTFYDYHVDWSQRLWLYFTSAGFYVKEFFRLTTIGGALSILFFFLGLGYLYRKKNHLLMLFVIWFLFWYFALVFYGSSSNHHFSEIRFPVYFLISSGIYWVINLVSGLKIKAWHKYFLILGIVFLVALDLTQSDKWLLHEKYENGNMEEVLSTAKILNNANIAQRDVIAVGLPGNSPLTLNYYTNLNLVYFDPATILRLSEKNKLQWAFDQFGVNRIIGYDKELTEKIIQSTNARAI